MKIVPVSLQGTTDALGDVILSSSGSVFGKLYAVEWIDGDLADGIDAVLSVQKTSSGVAQTLLTLTNANIDKWYYPRVSAQDEAGADAEVAATFDWRVQQIVNGTLRLVISDGGNAKTGGCIVYVEVQG
jgi:hypothetical protein